MTLSTRIDGEKISTKPSATSSACVAKSMTARITLRRAASFTPTMFTATRSTITTIPTITSHGFCLSGSQKIER